MEIVATFKCPLMRADPEQAGLVIALAGLASFLLVIVPVLGHWLRRRRVWLTEPEKLLEPRCVCIFSIWLAVALSGGVGVAVLVGGAVAYSAYGVLLAMFAALSAAHLIQSRVAGALGLAMVVVFCVTIGQAAISSTWAEGRFVGFLVGGLWLVWLSRFWKQQLRDGDAWTTAGRLIPVARGVGVLSILVSIITLGYHFWR